MSIPEAYPGFYSWVRATREATWGVRNPSPSSDTDVKWFRVVGDTNFHPTKTPARTIIRSADAYNRPVQVVSAKFSVAASLSTPFYPTQSLYLLDAALKLNAPDTDHPTPFLNSYTFDHFSGLDIRSYYGMRCANLGINSSAGPMNVLTDSNWIGRSVVDSAHTPDDQGNAVLTTFNQPASTVFPSELPWVHEESVGYLTLGGTAVANYDSMNISINNVISARHYENKWISHATWCGRDVSVSMGLLMTDTTWRAAYEAQTAMALIGGWQRGSNHVQFNFEGKSRVGTWADSRPLGDVITQNITEEVFFDADASPPGDLTYSVA